MHRAILILFVPVVLVVLAWPSAAQAQSREDDERARLHFQSGVSYFDQGRNEDALREWQEAYRLSNRHVLLMNIAQAHERLFQFTEAISALRRFLSIGGADAEERRTTVESRIEALRRSQERFAARTGGGTQPPPTEPPPTEPPPTEPPPPVEPPPPTEPPPTTEPPTTEPPVTGTTERPRRIWSWVALGATGLFGAGAIVFGALALGKAGELEDNCPNGVCPEGGGWEDVRDTGYTFGIVSDIFIGLTAAAAAGTVLAFILEGRRARQTEATANFVPHLSVGNAGFALHF